MNRRLALMTVLIFGMGVIFASCAAVQVKPTAANFKAPTIALEMIEVPQFDGYWYYGGKIKPTKGKAGNHGAPLPLAVTFNITNPNSYPVLLDGYKFTIAFEEFDLVTVKGYDTQWIPAGKTNQLRATTMITPRSALLSLLVTGGFKLKAKGSNPWAAMEKWWTTIPDMAFPITVHEGGATFRVAGMTKVVPFEAVWHGFVKRLRIRDVSMNYSDPKKPECVVVFLLKELSNLHIKIYSSQDLSTPIIDKPYSSEPSGNRRCIRIPFRMPKGKYYLVMKASNVEGEPKSVIDRRSFEVK